MSEQPRFGKSPVGTLRVTVAQAGLGVALGLLTSYGGQFTLLATIGVLVLVMLWVLPARRTVPVTFVALALVYIQAVSSGSYVGDVPLSTRYARDVLLVAMLLVYWLKSGNTRRRDPVFASVLALGLVGGGLLLRAGDADTISLVRYFTVMPILGWVTVGALAREQVDPERLVARTVVLVAAISAVVGLFQVAGILDGGFYAGYTTLGLPRSVGIIGQPNSQAYLLTLGIACCRVPGMLRRPTRRWLLVLLLAATIATFSRSAVVLIAIAFLMPAHVAGPRWYRKLRSPIVRGSAVLLLGLLPIFGAVRGTTVANDGRIVLAGSAVDALDATGFVIGDPALRNDRTTDNLWVDMLLIGGVGYAVAWMLLFRQMWKVAQFHYLARVAIVMLAMGGIFYSSFVLFPTVLYGWTIIAAPLARASLAGAGIQDSVVRHRLRVALRPRGGVRWSV